MMMAFVGPKGISAFIVEKESAGLTFGKKEKKVTFIHALHVAIDGMELTANKSSNV